MVAAVAPTVGRPPALPASNNDGGEAMAEKDFQSALQAKLARNAELAQQREQAEEEMDRAQREAAERAEREAAERRAEQDARHGELVERLQASAKALRAASPDDFVVRMGWTQSGEEFMAKISSRRMTPARSLFVELDRDDDEVLARWHSDRGDALELWHLLEVEPDLIDQLVLQVADQEYWKQATRPPLFPRVG